MRIATTLLILLGLSLNLMASEFGIAEIRSAFLASVSDHEKRENLFEKLNESKSKDATIQGYRGAVTAMMAECVTNPLSKYSYFSDGTELLEEMIAKDRQNAELRYLRFLIQCNSPEFLNYSDDINNDFEFILKEIKNTSERLSWMNDFITFTKKNPALKSYHERIKVIAL